MFETGTVFETGTAHKAEKTAQRVAAGKTLRRVEGELERISQEGQDYTVETAVRVCREFGFVSVGAGLEGGEGRRDRRG